ncbi:hypothetical protein FAZ95_36635 [Trinickia violacea]|uniref:Uncharacterized protein n=1 Tax=Trinickia violacea TaxID=2571746 RepID=A0A4P8J2S6_9BURK|nr:hypothetical protein [Trinickia violacea]QCP54443.1 hypothetical protein FAZ95_36635 [Trinickia violacea]
MVAVDGPVKTVEDLHQRLELLESRVSPNAAVITGVKGVRIMRIVALISSNALHPVLFRRSGRRGRWC